MALSPARVFTVLALAGVLTASSVACASDEPKPTASPDSVATESAPTPTATPAVENPGTPIAIGCDALVSPQTIYDLNPNFGLDPTQVPPAGSQGATIAGYQGLTCIWINETSGEKLTVAAAQLPAEVLTGIGNNLVETSNSVPTYGVEGYFQLVGEAGEAEAIAGSFWVVAVSTSFYEPGDAAPIMAAALSGLGA
ncbi:MAG: hypothetical protein ACOH1J_03435 [Microbacteriaceae bacterium]